MENDMSDASSGKRFHRVIHGQVQIDEEALSPKENEDERAWATLVQGLLPQSLPTQVEACSKLLEARFRGHLPKGITQAVSSLSALHLEQHARALLVDFLREHREASRLRKLFQVHLFFWERTEGKDKTQKISSEPVIELHKEPLADAAPSWEWVPLDEELQAPDVDDSSIRNTAVALQEHIGGYKPKELGAKIPELDNLDGVKSLLDVSLQQNSRSSEETMLLQRTANLGKAALDLLRYFSDNPGDKTIHAESVLGYPSAQINRLLLGSLDHYVKRSNSGGWECYPWVFELLTALDEMRKEG